MINIKKCLKSFSFAFKGITTLVRKENNARVHALATFLTLVFSWYANLTQGEWLWILLAIALVWIMEAINTAVEKLVDLAHPEFNPKAGEIKDIAAGAVLISALFALITGLIIFIPKFF